MAIRASLPFPHAPTRHFGSAMVLPLASLVAQTVKNLPALQGMQVLSLDQEDSVEKGMATHASILACRNSMDREAWQATVHEVVKGRTQLSD